MQDFVELKLKQDVLAWYGLPDILYPVHLNVLEEVAGGGDLPLAALLYGMQRRSREAGHDWKQFDAALERLATLVAPVDDREVISVSGDNWWLEIWPVDLDSKLVTIQRGEELVAAIIPREDGRLRVAAFRPLDAKSAGYLIGLSINPHPVHGVCMRENNWEYALDCSAGMGNVYAADEGKAYLSFWELGIGIQLDGSENPVFRPYKDLIARSAALVATELGVYYSLSDEGALPDEKENIPEGVRMNAQLIEVASWRIVSELHRRYPGKFVMVETHPCGGQYDCLSLFHDKRHVVDFNLVGGFHDFNGQPPLDIWRLLAEEEPLIVLDQVCRRLELPIPAKVPPSTPDVIAYRFIAAFLSHSVFGKEKWECRNGYFDSSGMCDSGVSHFFNKFSDAKDRLRIPMPSDLFDIPAYRFWFIMKDSEPVICLETTGTIWNDKGQSFDLTKLYKKEKRIWPVVMAIAGHLLP
jgi:hypothetical protein